MRNRMKGFTCCGDCIHYNYKKHKCNLCASVVTDARNPFYDDCPIPDIPSEQEIRNKAIEEFAEKFIYKAVCSGCSGCTNCYEEQRQCECEDWKSYMEIAEQMKEVGE